MCALSCERGVIDGGWGGGGWGRNLIDFECNCGRKMNTITDSHGKTPTPAVFSSDRLRLHSSLLRPAVCPRLPSSAQWFIPPSLHLFRQLSDRQFIHVFVWPDVYVSIRSLIHPFIWLNICVSTISLIHTFIWLSIHSFIYLTIHLCIHPFTHSSMYLAIHNVNWPFTHPSINPN